MKKTLCGLGLIGMIFGGAGLASANLIYEEIFLGANSVDTLGNTYADPSLLVTERPGATTPGQVGIINFRLYSTFRDQGLGGTAYEHSNATNEAVSPYYLPSTDETSFDQSLNLTITKAWLDFTIIGDIGTGGSNEEIKVTLEEGGVKRDIFQSWAPLTTTSYFLRLDLTNEQWMQDGFDGALTSITLAPSADDSMVNDYRIDTARLLVEAFEDLSAPPAGNVPVPEPATLALMGIGLVGLAGFGRKKAKS